MFISFRISPAGEGAKLLRRFEFKGGGETDFKPAIAEAAKWKPDLLIYLTDLQGDAGAEPAFPVLWAVPDFMGGKIIKGSEWAGGAARTLLSDAQSGKQTLAGRAAGSVIEIGGGVIGAKS